MFKNHQEKPSSPLRGRNQLNASFDNRYKQTLQERTIYQNLGGSNNEAHRERTFSMTGYKQRQDRNYYGKDEKKTSQKVKINANEERYSPVFKDSKEALNSKGTKNHFEASFQTNVGSDTVKSRHLQENLNFGNIKLDFPDKTQKINPQEPFIKEINEKELFDKISRINYLNEQINNRLQKMLSKIEEYQ